MILSHILPILSILHLNIKGAAVSLVRLTHRGAFGSLLGGARADVKQNKGGGSDLFL